jgi:hypothetical protein
LIWYPYKWTDKALNFKTTVSARCVALNEQLNKEES